MHEKHGGRIGGRLDIRLWLRMLSVTMTVEKRLRRNFAEQFDTTLPRFDVMAALERHPEGQSMGDLSQALLVSNGNVTAIVRQLEASGLVATRPDPRDRRSSIVSLTPEGASRFAEMAKAHHQWIGKAFAKLPVAEQKQLYELMAALKASIAEN